MYNDCSPTEQFKTRQSGKKHFTRIKGHQVLHAQRRIKGLTLDIVSL